jgi:ribosomal protein L7/L12
MNETLFVGGLFAVLVTLLLVRLSALERRINRLSRLDAKIDALLRHSGVEFDEFHDVPADVREALERGETILAIKRFRQATGAGLRDAKEFIDDVRRRRTTAG